MPPFRVALLGHRPRRGLRGLTPLRCAHKVPPLGLIAPAGLSARHEPGRIQRSKLVQEIDRERQSWIKGRFDPESTGDVVQAPDMTIFGSPRHCAQLGGSRAVKETFGFLAC